jgi:hypothetical protein
MQPLRLNMIGHDNGKFKLMPWSHLRPIANKPKTKQRISHKTG